MARRESPLRRTNPSGKIVWVARYTDADGKRKSAGTFKLRGPCRHRTDDGDCCAMHAIEYGYAHQKPAQKPRGLTVGEYFADWLSLHPRYERSALSYESKVRSVLNVPIDGVPLKDFEYEHLRRAHVRVIVDYMLRRQKRAASGASAIISVLSAMTEDALDDDVVIGNPFRGVRIKANDPRVEKKPRKVHLLSWEEMHAVARAAGEYEPMVRVLSDCGLRLGELFALERKDLQDGVLRVGKIAWRGRVYEGTKTTHGVSEDKQSRRVPVPFELQGMLERMPKRIDTRLLFPRPSGGVWREATFYRVVWEPAVAATGTEATPHHFRHSWVSHMRAGGIDPADLAEAAGHTVQTATKTYTHSTGRTFDAMRRTVG